MSVAVLRLESNKHKHYCTSSLAHHCITIAPSLCSYQHQGAQGRWVHANAPPASTPNRPSKNGGLSQVGRRKDS